MYNAGHNGPAQVNGRNARPLSFLPSPRGEVIDTPPLVARQLSGAKPYSGPRFHNPFSEDNIQTLSSSGRSLTAPALGAHLDRDDRGWGGPRHVSGADRGFNQQHMQQQQQHQQYMHHDEPDENPSFSLGEIDVDTSPDAVAREFSNLQALRRMSLDVNLQDPDLPSFAIPAVAPASNVDEDDPSRMYWVPARLHPELAPKEFKSFIQEKVKTIRRSSLSTSLSDDQAPMQSNSGSLRRRKSMLSRQIDNGSGYEDGAVRLQRKQSYNNPNEPQVNLHELEQIMNDPDQVAKRLSLEMMTTEEIPEGAAAQDLPMLPVKPLGPTLKRSTRTQYRKGSLRKNPLLARKQNLREEEESSEPSEPASEAPRSSGSGDMSDLFDFADQAFGLNRVQTEPLLAIGSKQIENFSRPSRRAGPGPSTSFTPSAQQSRQTDLLPTSPVESKRQEAPAVQKPEYQNDRPSPADQYSRYGPPRPNVSAAPPAPKAPIPQIVEPAPEPRRMAPPQEARPMSAPSSNSQRSPPMEQSPLQLQNPQSRPIAQRAAARPQSLPHRPPTNHRAQNITLDDIAASSIIGSRNEGIVLSSGAEDGKKADKKLKAKDESRKTSWGWFGGSSGDKDEKEGAKRNKLKSQKAPDKAHDNARLDILQGAIDGTAPKTRESAVFDRQSLQLEDDSRKANKKGANEQKKEKDGLFSTLFGSGKKKGDRDSVTSKKHASSLRGLSPDPPRRMSRPDIDYPWTRFTITEERAIYRMAHIKLANPRRELYSQVLLSNFMYSYLAKVQQMHPHVQIPQSAAQKQAQRQERQQQQKQAEQDRKQERQDKQREQETQRQMRLAQQEAEQDDYLQHQQFPESQYDAPYDYHDDVGAAEDEQAAYNAHQQHAIHAANAQYQRQQAQYGQQQQYMSNGSSYPNGHDWPAAEQHRQHQWYQVEDQDGNGGRDGFW